MSGLRAHGPALTAWLVSVAALLLPGSPEGSVPPWLWPLVAAGLDKVVHVLLFAALTVTVARSARRLPLDRPWVATAALATSWAAATEWAQGAIPHRHPAWADFAADLAGVGLAAVVVAAADRRRLAILARPPAAPEAADPPR